jgi:hypothetical protein
MKRIILILLLVEALFSQAQTFDYQPISATRTALFQNIDNNQIVGLRIDSVQNQTNTVLHPFATIQEVHADGCISPYKASWIGEKVLVAPNGSNYFFNRNGDTIRIDVQATLNQTWIAFNSADTLKIEATVSTIASGNVMGIADTLKTIVFKALDLSGKTVENAVNNKRLVISKNHGFVETLNFYLFPNLNTRVPASSLSSYNLVGLSNPNIGVQNLTWFDAHNFQVGDELHVHEHNTGDESHIDPLHDFDNRCIYKYIKRSMYPDSIVYRYARQQSIQWVYADSTKSVYHNDTVKWVVLANAAFDQVPGVPIVADQTVYSMYMLYTELREKVDPSSYLMYVENGNCFGKQEGEGCFIDKRYIEGLGGPYYSCTGYMGETQERKLVYYKKGQTEWGTQLVLTGLPNIERNKSVQVRYNSDLKEVAFRLSEADGTQEVQIFTQTGQLVKINQFEGTECRLCLDGYPQGVYLYRFTWATGEVQTGKLQVR